MMYIYYNDIGEIQGISPMPEESEFLVASIEYEHVSQFIDGSADMARFIVMHTDTGIELQEKKLERSVADISLYLAKTMIHLDRTDLSINTDTANKKITVVLNTDLRTAENNSSSSIRGMTTIQLHYTLHSDPHFLVYSVRIPAVQLLSQGHATIDYTGVDLSGTTIYTKNILSYSHRIN